MSGYWAQRLGQGQQQAPATPQAPPSNRPWWQPAPVTPAPQAAPQPVPAQPQQASVNPDGTSHFGDLLTQSGYTPSEKVQSAKDTERCPNCTSPQYVAEPGKPNAMKHCFDCGYNPRFGLQTMAGISGTGTNVPVRTARMQNQPVEGAPPMGAIVGHA